MKKLFFIKLLVLLLLIFITRFLKLSEVPLHLTQDEIVVGYEGYSIWRTGADEWGEKFPLIFRSIGDYKQPVLGYLVAVSVGLLGLTEWAVRLPVGIFSSLSVLLLWWMSERYVFNQRYKYLGFLVAVILVVSPWHIRPSRMSHDAVIALFFVLVNLVAWLAFLEKQKLRYMGVGIWGGLLAIMSYHSTKVFVPLMNVSFVLMFRNEIVTLWEKEKRNKRGWVIIGVISLVILWVGGNYILGRAATRGQSTFVAKDFEYARLIRPLVTAWWGQGVLLVAFWWGRLLEYMDPSFYLSDGLELVLRGRPGQGVLLGTEWLALLLGIGGLLMGKVRRVLKKEYLQKILWVYLLLAFLPASLANNSRHPYRTGLALPVICLLIVLGWWILVGWWRRRNWLVIGVILVSYLWGLASLLDNYLIHYPVQLSEYRQYPWGEVASDVNGIRENYDLVVVDPAFGTEGPYTIGVPQYYFLFYGRYDPALYQMRVMKGADTYDFENFAFRGIEWQKENKKGVLYVGSPWSFRTREGVVTSQILGRYKFKNGAEAIWVVEGAN